MIQPILRHHLHLHPLLLLTFTNLTPPHMNHPLHKRIQQPSFNHPNNQHLKNHPIKIHQPHISTLHTFSFKFIHHHYHVLDIHPHFTTTTQPQNI
ncbi:UvrD-helicase domain-containing protein, partial [Staphylococcus epidermidis]|uniref:UvrD-helicase domain-containing protein n=1 Tax=Staphylococcus epidermidis TaxID=1282 RepID=UPI0037D9ABA1